MVQQLWDYSRPPRHKYSVHLAPSSLPALWAPAQACSALLTSQLTLAPSCNTTRLQAPVLKAGDHAVHGSGEALRYREHRGAGRLGSWGPGAGGWNETALGQTGAVQRLRVGHKLNEAQAGVPRPLTPSHFDVPPSCLPAPSSAVASHNAAGSKLYPAELKVRGGGGACCREAEPRRARGA